MDRIFSYHPAAKDAHGAVALPLQAHGALAFGAIALGLALGALALGVLGLGDISLALGDISLTLGDISLGTLVLALRRKRW